MKKMIILFALVLTTLTAVAVPAKRGQMRTIQLNDGTTVQVQLVGDEFGHFWRANDGRTFRKTKEGFVPITGKAISERAQKRRAAANRHRAKRQMARKPQLRAAQPETTQRAAQFGDYEGEKKGLIILVEFNDENKFQPENNQALYNRIANEEGFREDEFVGSVYDYFLAQSEGLFKLKFDVVGPYTLENERAYYGGNADTSEAEDLHPAEMIVEACKNADNDVDFRDYDWDGDGEVDQVFVLYAGAGEANGGDDDTVWPHEWNLSDANYFGDGPGAIRLDSVTINTYACSNELQPAYNYFTGTMIGWKIDGIGTICHEFSHCLGYPDFYDTNYENSGMGYWDLMDSGAYNGEGFCPAGYTSYERWVAGWKEPIELAADKEITGMKALQNDGETYIIYNDGNRNEYFLLENRQWTGWDEEIPGEGLLILHVDYDQRAWEENEVNTTKNHERMTWIAADNTKKSEEYDGAIYYDFYDMEYDPYPYKKNNSFTNTSKPAANLFNRNTDGSKKLNKSVLDITQNSNGTISFKFEAKTGGIDPTGNGSYKIITNKSDLEENVDYLIVYEASETAGVAYAGHKSGDNIGLKVDITIDGHTTDGANANPVKLEKADNDNWYIFDGSNYLYYNGTGNKLYASQTKGDSGFTWKISTSQITNTDFDTRFLQYNSNSNGLRFACYTGSQKHVVIYKNTKPVTGVKTLTTDANGAKQGIYTLQGVKITTKTPLQPGIYIQNGKKIVVK